MASITVGELATVVNTFSLPSIVSVRASAPSQLSTSHLPLLFPRSLVLENSERSLTFGSSSLTVITFEICIVVEAVRQGNQDDTYILVRDIIDELQAEIEDKASDLKLDFYTIRETFETAGETAFFAVVANIRASA